MSLRACAAGLATLALGLAVRALLDPPTPATSIASIGALAMALFARTHAAPRVVALVFVVVGTSVPIFAARPSFRLDCPSFADMLCAALIGTIPFVPVDRIGVLVAIEACVLACALLIGGPAAYGYVATYGAAAVAATLLVPQVANDVRLLITSQTSRPVQQDALH